MGKKKLFITLSVISVTKLLLASVTSALIVLISISVKLVKHQNMDMGKPMYLLNCTDVINAFLLKNMEDFMVDAVVVQREELTNLKRMLHYYKNRLQIFLHKNKLKKNKFFLQSLQKPKKCWIILLPWVSLI